MNHLFQCCRRNEYWLKPILVSKKVQSAVLLLCLVLIGSGCGNTSVKPVDISANDVCFYCKSPIIDVAYAGEFVTKTGFVRKFDDIGCLAANARKVGKKNILAFYVMDVRSKTWFPADQMQFVRSDKIGTPRNGGIVAFQDAAQAQQIASRFQGELIKFEDIVK